MALLTSLHRHVPDLTASSHAVTKITSISQKLSGPSWVTSNSSLHLFLTSSRWSLWRRHQLCSFRVFWDFVVFRTFSLRKRPKMLLLWFSLQKYLKWEKKRLWVKSNQIIYELGLKRPPKSVTFFVSSNTLTLEICLSSSKWAFIPIKIWVRGHLTRI